MRVANKLQVVRDPARAALAEVIGAASVANEAASKQRATVEAARRRVTTAETRLAEAETALADAKAALIGDSVPAALREARLAVADAADVLDAARVALAKAEAAAEEPEYQAHKAGERVKEAAARVIFGRFPMLQERLERIHEELATLQAEFRFLWSNSPSAYGNAEMSLQISRAQAVMNNTAEYLWRHNVDVLDRPDPRWTAALQALLTDADAELPA